MPIHIDAIKVQRLGPIASLDWTLGKLNLIYGKNEQGKTHVVEFLIRSLFKSSRHWALRDSAGSGRVLIRGLEESALAFSPRSREKLDSLWESERGLPQDFSRLLVVKGAELAISGESKAGVGRSTIKHFLSGRQLLERIQKRIPVTVQESRLLPSEITGSRRGEIKERELLLDRLKTLNQLFTQVNKRFSGGQSRVFELELSRIDGELEKQAQARAYLAYQLHKQIEGLELRKRQLSREVLQSARDQLNLYRQKQREWQFRRETLNLTQEKSRHYAWLDKATDLYEQLIAQAPSSVGWPLPVLAGCFAVMTAVAAFFKYWPVTLAALLLMAMAGLLIYRRMQALLQRKGESDELNRLQDEYRDRFDVPLTGLAQLREHLLQCQEHHAKARLLTEQLESDKRILDEYETGLEQAIFQLTGQNYPRDRWEPVLLETGKTLEKLEETLQNQRIQLAQLDVDATDYRETATETEYSRHHESALHEKRAALQREMAEEEAGLEDLKRAIFNETRDREARNWEDLLEGLRRKREEASEGYRQKTAQIIGKKLVHCVIQRLERDEDEKIAEALSHAALRAPLQALTGRYTDFELQDQDLRVTDGLDSYGLTDLSTGAREQVLLALRMGFASRLAGEDALFLILDDAFQYSDWTRRPRLVSQMTALARAGWQINYFTMDDHIRDLFVTAGETLGDDFRLFELGES